MAMMQCDEREAAPDAVPVVALALASITDDIPAFVFGSVTEALAKLEPGVAAMAYLQSLDVDTLDEYERVEVMKAWERQHAWVMAQSQRSIVAVAGTQPTPDDDWACAEVAAALRLSSRTADQRVDIARLLASCLPLTNAALESGAISWRHVVVLVQECTGLPEAVLSAVEARVIERAAKQTTAEFGRSVRRAAVACADVTAELDYAIAKQERGVWLQREPDGMASLSASLTAPEAEAAFSAIDFAARARAGATDETGRKLGIDERRADALLAALLGSLCEHGRNGDHGPNGERGPNGEHDPNREHGPNGKRDPNREHGPNGKRDPNREHGPNGKREDGAARRSRAGSSRPRVPVEVQVVVDLPTLLGLADNPAELAGYGPIPAGMARELADDANWRRLVTDPLTADLLDFGRRTYRPPKPLVDFLRARDRRCRFPGCGQPAVRCDIDHDRPWDKGGTTCKENCCCLCRRHHRLKTHGGWHLDLRSDGTCVWTSPAGHRYTLRPPPQLDTG